MFQAVDRPVIICLHKYSAFFSLSHSLIPATGFDDSLNSHKRKDSIKFFFLFFLFHSSFCSVFFFRCIFLKYLLHYCIIHETWMHTRTLDVIGSLLLDKKSKNSKFKILRTIHIERQSTNRTEATHTLFESRISKMTTRRNQRRRKNERKKKKKKKTRKYFIYSSTWAMIKAIPFGISICTQSKSACHMWVAECGCVWVSICVCVRYVHRV